MHGTSRGIAKCHIADADEQRRESVYGQSAAFQRIEDDVPKGLVPAVADHRGLRVKISVGQ